MPFYCKFCDDCVSEYEYIVDLIGNYNYVFVRTENDKLEHMDEEAMCCYCLERLNKYKVDISTKAKQEVILEQIQDEDKPEFDKDSKVFILPLTSKSKRIIHYYDF